MRGGAMPGGFKHSQDNLILFELFRKHCSQIIHKWHSGEVHVSKDKSKESPKLLWTHKTDKRHRLKASSWVKKLEISLIGPAKWLMRNTWIQSPEAMWRLEDGNDVTKLLSVFYLWAVAYAHPLSLSLCLSHTYIHTMYIHTHMICK